MDKVVKRAIEESEHASDKCKNAATEAEKAFDNIISHIRELYSATITAKTGNEQNLNKIKDCFSKRATEKHEIEKKVNDRGKEYDEIKRRTKSAFEKYQVCDYAQDSNYFLSLGRSHLQTRNNGINV